MDTAKLNFYTEEDYYNLPEDERAELIYGHFYDMASPSRQHQRILGELYLVIGQYIKSRGGSCHVYPAPFAVRLFGGNDDRTIVEPDISVICDHDKLTDRGCNGAPDWIVEIVSPGNPGHDYIRKLNLYAEAGVREYWIVDPGKESVIVYHLRESEFEMGSFTFRDKIKVNIYDDLWVDFRELDI